MRMKKYTIIKREKCPAWLATGLTIAAFAYLAMDICKAVWDVGHTSITEVEK